MENHAWWLMSTVFLIMMPALGRGMQNLYIAINFKDWPDVDIMFPLYLTQAIILGLLFFWARKYCRLNHPATYLAAAVNVFTLLLEPLGRSLYVQRFLTTLLQG